MISVLLHQLDASCIVFPVDFRWRRSYCCRCGGGSALSSQAWLLVAVFDREQAIEGSWSAAHEQVTGKSTLDQAFLAVSGSQGGDSKARDEVAHMKQALGGRFLEFGVLPEDPQGFPPRSRPGSGPVRGL